MTNVDYAEKLDSSLELWLVGRKFLTGEWECFISKFDSILIPHYVVRLYLNKGNDVYLAYKYIMYVFVLLLANFLVRILLRFTYH